MNDIQKVVLGCIISDHSIHDKVIPILKPKYFDGKHRFLFDRILELYTNGEPVDSITLYNRLGKNNHWSAVELAKLTDLVTSTANVLSYVQALKHEYIRRELDRKFDVKVEEYDDPTKQLSELVTELTEMQEDSVISRSKNLIEILETAVDEMLTEQKTDGIIGIPTPITRMNTDTRGFRKGELIVLAGRPRMGKSAFALSIVKTACGAGKKVAYFSMEMRSTELVKRLIRSYGLPPDQGAGEISRFDLHLFDRGGIDLNFIRSNVRLLKDVDFVVIDYLGLMKLNPYKKRNEALGEATRELKEFAMEEELPILLLCQLNRSVESRSGYRHELSDLRESGDIEQDADKVIFIYRPELMDVKEFDGEPSDNLAIIQKEKDRNGKSPVFYKSRVNSDVSQFYDWDDFHLTEPVTHWQDTNPF